MDNTNEPAAGVWRDAKTQRIRPSEGRYWSALWLVELRVLDITIYRVCRFSTKTGRMVPLLENDEIPMDQVTRYARINT